MKKPFTTTRLILWGMRLLLIALPVCTVVNLLAACGVVSLIPAFATHGCLLIAVIVYAIQSIYHHRHPCDPETEDGDLLSSARRLYRGAVAVMLVLIVWTTSLVAAVFLGGM